MQGFAYNRTMRHASSLNATSSCRFLSKKPRSFLAEKDRFSGSLNNKNLFKSKTRPLREQEGFKKAMKITTSYYIHHNLRTRTSSHLPIPQKHGKCRKFNPDSLPGLGICAQEHNELLPPSRGLSFRQGNNRVPCTNWCWEWHCLRMKLLDPPKRFMGNG